MCTKRFCKQCRKQCPCFGAHHPDALRLLKRYKKYCQAKKKQYSILSAVDTIIHTAKRNPWLFWRQLPSSRTTPRLVPSAGDPTELYAIFPGLFNRHAAADTLRALHTGSSSGTVGVPAEFFKRAVKRDRSDTVEGYLLAPYLAQIVYWCFQQGTAPDDWGVALLAMIHKGGAD